MSEQRLIDANILAKCFKMTAERIASEQGVFYGIGIANIGAMLEDGTLGITVDAVPREEHESLLKRFRHLLESDYIRSFDEVKLGTSEYKRDIREAGRVLMVDSEPVVRCGECKHFCQYAQGFAPRVENADGDCYIRLVHSEAHPQFSAVRKNDYCSMGAKKEVLKDEFHQHNEVT